MKKSEEELLEALNSLVVALDLIDEINIPVGTWIQAHRLCAPTDPKDTPYVALALHCDADLWTEDQILKDGLSARGSTRFFNP